MDYRDKFYSKYISNNASNLYSKPDLVEIKKQFSAWSKYFKKFLPENKDAKIIELGCGYGGFIYWLQEAGYSNAEGVDIGVEQIETAKEMGIKNINQGDLRDFIKNKKDFYDVIFMRDVLEHFAKDGILDILEFVYESLKNKGIVIVQIPNAENLFSGRLRYGDFSHEISFTENSINQIFSVSGFKNLKVLPVPRVIHGIKSLIRFIFWKIIELCLRFYLLIETGSGKRILTPDLIVIAGK